MNIWVIGGVLLGAAVAVMVFFLMMRLHDMNRYEKAIKAYIGDDDKAAYDERTMIRSYDSGLTAAFAAREMVSAARDESQPSSN